MLFATLTLSPMAHVMAGVWARQYTAAAVPIVMRTWARVPLLPDVCVLVEEDVQFFRPKLHIPVRLGARNLSHVESPRFSDSQSRLRHHRARSALGQDAFR